MFGHHRDRLVAFRRSKWRECRCRTGGFMIGQSLLPELDRELANSRTMLELVPEANAKFKPHEKSSELGKLAMHVANLPYWVALTFAGTEFDANPEGGIVRPSFTTTAALLEFFD